MLGSLIEISDVTFFDNGAAISTRAATCFDEGPLSRGQLYEDVIKEGTDWETETTPKPLVILERLVLTSINKIGPSVIDAEVEGPPSWPKVSVAGTGHKDK